jgi:methylated-DNA-[protein]-cysteine S-methyltransferase
MPTDPVFFRQLGSPLGPLLVLSNGDALVGLFMENAKYRPEPDPSWRAAHDANPFRAIRRELEEYFAGERTRFEVPLAPGGTPFQRAVWRELERIPYGTTTSYREIARRVGRPLAVRAVGAANGRNPISIVVPCHRVVGADGSLTGYAGGEDAKRRLLDLERSALVPKSSTGSAVKISRVGEATSRATRGRPLGA